MMGLHFLPLLNGRPRDGAPNTPPPGRRLNGQVGLYAAAFVVLAATGAVHGLLCDRWAPADAGDAALLDRVPASVGDWDGTTIDQGLNEVLRTTPGNVLLRRYVNRTTGAVVTLFLTTGQAGPIVASHSPDSCYPGAGYSFAAPMKKHAVTAGPDDRRHEFWVADFSKTERASPLCVRVFWAWTPDGTWQVPDSPRLTFAGRKRLFKMYVIRQMLREGEGLEGDPAIPFIQAVAPELQRTLMSGGT
jgi:hypothetical protein